MSGLETSLRYDVEALRNLSFKLSLQSMPRIRVDVDGHDSNSKVTSWAGEGVELVVVKIKGTKKNEPLASIVWKSVNDIL